MGNVDRLFTEIAHELLQQAKAKDLPSESHSVQNISESNIGQSSSVKSNCCSKVMQRDTNSAIRILSMHRSFPLNVSTIELQHLCRAFLIFNNHYIPLHFIYIKLLHLVCNFRYYSVSPLTKELICANTRRY